jgi:UDP-N-acetylmuramoyl-L-alanyl-D-glutamate--2,6-diaminopimelate ligase
MGLGHKCGLLSTVVNKIQREETPSTHTTPNPIELNRLLRQMVDEGCSHCFMEVSSHALVQRRTEGLNFKIGIFTNITHEHLDYHGTFDGYIKAKKMLFDDLGTNSFALLNRDDFHNEIMVQNTKAKVLTYGLKTMADFKCKIIENDFTGLLLNVENKEVWTRLIGRFNAYNVLTAYSTAKLLDEDSTEVLTEISNLTPVRGRFQQIKGSNGVTGIVDYAHTPDALLKVLETINEIKTDDQQVFTIIGCGGNRDKTKRPTMAKIAVQNSDKVILTSDNPRNEDPEAIIMDMEKGVDPVNSKKTLAITNRKEAIKAAVSQAKSNDIILIAGKGHETYQLVRDQVLEFNDMEILTEYLKQFAS